MPSPLDQQGIDALMKKRNKGWHEEVRYDYPLTNTSEVWDVGAWRGEFTRELVRRYGCHVEVFELIPRIQGHLREWFADLPHNVNVHPYGLGASNEQVTFLDGSECTSALVSGDTTAQIHRMSERLPSHVALVKINIEGMEYDLLDDLIHTGAIHSIQHLQVQFHDFIQVNGVYLQVPDAQERYDRIREALNPSHVMQWNQPWVWESWRKR